MIAPQFGYPPVSGLYQQPAPIPQQQPVQQQIRSGGIVSVSGEEEARRYPVAPGYTVTMRDDTGPYLYEKTMGFSQLDQPIFRKARIVFEDAAQAVQEKQEQQNAQLQASKQPFVIMAVDKKRLKLKESGLPDEVINNTPWYAKRAKVPVVKAKIGNRFMNLIADENVFDYIPINKQVKAMISGIYIVEVKGMRGQKLVSDNPVKKSWWRRQMDKLREKAGAKPVK